MADETTKPEEEEALSNDDFLATLAKGSGFEEPKPDETTGEVDEMAGMKHQLNMLQLDKDVRDTGDGFKAKYPDATEATIQKYITSVRNNDMEAMADAIEAAVRTGIEAETRNEQGPRTLAVEAGSDEASALGDVPMNWNQAAMDAAGVTASELF
jgi:hypothetical protein